VRLLSLAALVFTSSVALAADPVITWKKVVLDPRFRSEGVAAFDVNNDGKKDVANGEYWYEAPNWTPHEMQPPKDHGTGEKSYSRSFCCWAEDLNGDGFLDLIVIDFPGEPCYWMENPKGKDGHWKKHLIWHSACNETPQYADLLGTGKKVLIMGFQPEGKQTEGQMAYFTPDPKDPYAKWIMHPISEPSTPPEMKDGKPVPRTGKEIPGTQKFSHGLGVGDMNKDGKLDVICTGGWWEQPAKADGVTPWTFHPERFGEACADMFAVDLENTGTPGVLSTSAHKFGVWYQRPFKKDPKKPEYSWETITLFGRLASETHAAHFVDIDGDGLKDLVTGKRYWSHGRSEPGHDWDACTYWLKAKKEKDGIITFTPHLIDADCGVGTQFAVEDVNGDGLLDIVVSNKKGVRVLYQQRK
jgi:hypothetical protein